MKTITRKIRNKKTGEIVEYKEKVPYGDATTKQQFGQLGGAILNPLETARNIIPERMRPPSLEEATGVSKFMEDRAPIAGDVQDKFQQLTGRGVTSGLNVAGMGAPNVLARKAGIDMLPQAQSPEEMGADVVGGVAGGVTGAPGAMYKGITGSKSLSSLPLAMKEAIAGGAVGGAYTPEDALDFSNSDNIEQLKRRAKQAGIGAGSAVALGVGTRAIKDLYSMASSKGQVKLFETVRDYMTKAKTNAVTKFGNELDDLQKSNPKQGVDIEDAIQELDIERQLPAGERDYKFVSYLRRSKTLRRYLENPKKLSLRESQNIINELEEALPARVHQGNVELSEKRLLDLIEGIKSAQDTPFPKMPLVRNDYRKVIEPYNQVKGSLEVGKTGQALTGRAGEISGKGGMFSRDVEWQTKMLPNLLPPEVIKQLGGARNANNIISALGRIASVAGIAGTGAYLLHRKIASATGFGGGGDTIVSGE